MNIEVSDMKQVDMVNVDMFDFSLRYLKMCIENQNVKNYMKEIGASFDEIESLNYYVDVIYDLLEWRDV